MELHTFTGHPCSNMDALLSPRVIKTDGNELWFVTQEPFPLLKLYESQEFTM